jgi:hypothetical protein
MAQYTPTQCQVLFSTHSAEIAGRVRAALIQYAATLYGAASGQSLKFIDQLARNPDGMANAVIPVLIPLMQVASPGTDVTPNLPTDAEFTTGLTAFWGFFILAAG